MPQTQEFASANDQDSPDTVQARAADAAQHAQQTAQSAVGQVQEKLREQIDQRSSQVATQVSEQASDLRSVGESLREQGRDGPAQAAEQLAQYAEKVGSYLRSRDSQALLGDAEDFGRRQPWAVAVGGLALGFAASRFLKASSRQRYHGRPTTVPRPAGVYASPAGGNGSAEPPSLGAPARGRAA